jgi:hypothetical protein
MIRTVSLCSFVLLACSTLSRSAFAQSKTECIDAYEQAQSLRMDGHLKAARDQLLVCNQPACPVLARDDCSRWLAEVQAAMPSIAVAAKDAAGKDVVDITVQLDGERVLDALFGRAFQIDPGVHALRVESPGREPIEQRIVVVEGEKLRAVNVVFSAPTKALPPALPAAKARSNPPVLGYALAGVGAVGLAGFAYFATSGLSARQDLQSTCAPHCAQDDVDAARRKLIIGDISLGIGTAAALGAGYLLFLRPRHDTTAAVQVGNGGAYAVVTGRF